jgi:glycosyltransferase involved in cell wall biosynthesis
MTDLAVIMSVYKNDKLMFVKESVQSILDQTFTQFHYYIVFDGPVPADIDNYITSLVDPRVKHYRLENNGGLAAALNILLDIVLKNQEYKFIARMDADDVSLTNRFEKQRNYLLKNPDISIVGCWYQEIDENGKHLSDRKLPTDHEALVRYYYRRAPFAHASVTYRRELIEKAGNYPVDTILMEDNVLWGRAINSGLRFGNIPDYLFFFRITKNFYKRRSGIKYGYFYILTRFKSLRQDRYPIVAYFYSFGTGIIKMLPSFVTRIFYFCIAKIAR